MDDFTVPAVPGFLVGRMLGRGGSSTVWLVTEERTGREFALKCFRGGRGQDVAAQDYDGEAGTSGDIAAAEEAIRREIRILSVLDHQHLIKAHDAVRVFSLGGTQGGVRGGAQAGQPAMVAESGGGAAGLLLDYAPGGSLGELVGSRVKLTIGETVTVLTPIAQVLGYLHGKGFTHGDVSPGNVLFTGHGKPMLSDVGIARMVGDATAVADQGTAGFMDPSPVDAVRAGLQPERDVYSVAALGWYCLTGEAPRRTADRPPLSLLLPDVPPDLAAALEAGLNEDRRLRPTAVEFATAVYRSAPPLPVDLASSVHPTVIPQLLTRHRLPERPGGTVRSGLSAWWRRISTSRWSGLVGARQRLPFPAGEEPEAPQSRTPEPNALKPAVLVTEAEKTVPRRRHARDTDLRRPNRRALRAGPGRGSVLLAAGTAAVVVATIWAAAVFGPDGPWAVPAGPGGAVVASTGDNAPEAPDEGLPPAVAVQLGSADPLEAVQGLATVRSLAFSSGRFELLDLVNAVGSPAAAADARIKASLQQTGRVLSGFTSTVSELQVQPGSSSSQAVVAVTSATSAYEERDASGTVVSAGAPVAAQDLRLVLVSVDGRWRITDVLPGS